MTDEKQQPTVPLMTAGNLLTLSRLLLLPFVVVGIAKGIGFLTVGAMAAALITDLLDGRVARRLKQASLFGRALDSTIDFVLIYSLFIAFYAAGRLTTLQFAVVFVAMIFNLILQISSMGADADAGIVRTRLGKLTGALQYTYLLFLVAREVLLENKVMATVNTVIFVALAVSVVLSSVEAIIKLRKIV